MAFSRAARMTVLCAVLAAASPSLTEAAEPATRDQIIRASKSYPGAGRAAADYQATESQKAAQRLIDQLNQEKEEEAKKKAAAQRTVIPGPAAQAPVVTQRSYEVKNELLPPEDTAATQRQKAIGVEHRMLQGYND